MFHRRWQLMSVTTLSLDNLLLLLNLTDGCFTGDDSWWLWQLWVLIMLLLLNLTDGCFTGRLMRVTALSIDSIYVAVVKSLMNVSQVMTLMVFMLLLSNLTDGCFTGDDTDGIYVAVVKSHWWMFHRGWQLMVVTTLSSDNMLLLLNLMDECFTGDDTDGIYVAVVKSHWWMFHRGWRGGWWGWQLWATAASAGGQYLCSHRGMWGRVSQFTG